MKNKTLYILDLTLYNQATAQCNIPTAALQKNFPQPTFERDFLDDGSFAVKPSQVSHTKKDALNLHKFYEIKLTPSIALIYVIFRYRRYKTTCKDIQILYRHLIFSPSRFVRDGCLN